MRRRIFYGWWIVLLGSIINAVGTGILYHSFTVFFLPLRRDFGVSSAALSLLYASARLEGGIEGPLIGYLIDRFGARALIITGVSIAGIGLILLATVHSFWAFFLIYIFLVSFGYNAGFNHPITTTVNNWFIRQRGIGLSCLSASANIGAMIMAPLLSYIILNLGWRTGVVVAGLVILIIGLPSALPIYRSPEVMGLSPDGKPLDEVRGNTVSEPENIDFATKEAVKTVTFWMLMAAMSLRLFVTIALSIHFIPILVWRGTTEVKAAYLVSLLAFTTIVTTLGLGWLGDRWSKCALCSLSILGTIMAMVCLLLSQASLIIYFFPIGLAITMGTAPLNWALIGDFFGRRSYATLRGIMGVAFGAATFFSPVYAGWIFDRTGNYTAVLVTFTIILLLSASIFALLPSRFKPKDRIRPAVVSAS